MQKGFTIVELLVIIVVIGVLASITILTYNGVQNQARDSAVQSDLDAIAGHLEAYRVRTDAANPSHQFPTTEGVLDTLEIQATKSAYDTTITYNMIYCVATTGTDAYQDYALVAKSKSGSIFMMTEDGFQSHSLTSASLTATLCTTLGMTLVSNGMNPAGTWKTWVHSS